MAARSSTTWSPRDRSDTREAARRDRRNAELVKPIHRAVALRDKMSRRSPRARPAQRFARRSWVRAQPDRDCLLIAAVFDDAGRPREVDILDASERVPPGIPTALVRRAREILREKRISVSLGSGSFRSHRGDRARGRSSHLCALTVC